MDSELLAQANVLIDSEQDTMAATEMILAAIYEQHSNARRGGGNSSPSAEAVAREGSQFLTSKVQSAREARRNSTTTASSSSGEEQLTITGMMSEEGAAAMEAWAAATTSSRSSSESVHEIDARELLTAVLGSIASHLRGDTRSNGGDDDDGADDDDDADDGNRRNQQGPVSIHELQSLLLVAPHLLNVVHKAMPLLLLQSFRRASTTPSVSSSTNARRTTAMWSVIAWMPQLLCIVRDCNILATQQDGEVQFVDTSSSPTPPLDSDAAPSHHNTNGARSTTSTSPSMIEAAVLTNPQNLFTVSVTILSECATLLQEALAMARWLSPTVAASDAPLAPPPLSPLSSSCAAMLPAKRHDLFRQVVHQLFTAMCAVRATPVVGTLFRPDSSCGAEHTGVALLDASGSFASLTATVRSLETACETKHRKQKDSLQQQRLQQQQAQSRSNDDQCCSSHKSHCQSDPADIPCVPPPISNITSFDSVRRMLQMVVRVCSAEVGVEVSPRDDGSAAAARIPNGSYFQNAFASLASSNVGVAATLPVHRNTSSCGGGGGCDGDDHLLQLSQLVYLWSGVVQHNLLESPPQQQQPQQQHLSSSRALGKLKANNSVKAIAARLRDSALHFGEHQQDTRNGQPTAAITEADERQILAQRMDLCTRVEAAVKPLMLISSDDEDDEDGDGGEDGHEGSHDDGEDIGGKQLLLPTTLDSSAPLLPGVMFALLDLFACQGDNIAEGTAPWVASGVVSLAMLVESFGLSPIRLLLKSKSLSGVSAGLRLWSVLLTLLPKYSLDTPGEVRLTTLAQSRGNSGEEEGGSVEVECNDLLVDDDALFDTPAMASPATQHLHVAGAKKTSTSHGNAFRTNRFASHYYLFQDILSVVVLSPSAVHRLAARSIALRKHLTWYVAPIRSKLLCQVIFTAPFGSVATALLQKLKEEIIEGYCGVMEQLTAANHHSETSAVVHRRPHVQLGVGKWFLNMAVLQYLIGSLKQWTARCCRSGTGKQGNNRGIATTLSSASQAQGDTSFVEPVATALNVVYTMLQWEQRIAQQQHVVITEGHTSVRSVLFDLECVPRDDTPPSPAGKSAVSWRATGQRASTKYSGTNDDGQQKQRRLACSGDFVHLLRVAVCAPWSAACRMALGNSADDEEVGEGVSACHVPEISPLDAFSIQEMLRRITAAVVAEDP